MQARSCAGCCDADLFPALTLHQVYPWRFSWGLKARLDLWFELLIQASTEPVSAAGIARFCCDRVWHRLVSATLASA
jgi:hypothetical protein